MKKSLIVVLFAALIFLSFVFCSYADQAVYAPGSTDGTDVWLSSTYDYGDNYGVDDYKLQAGGWGDEYRFLIRFDIADLPVCPISAVMWMAPYDRGDYSVPVDMYMDLVTEQWDEDTGWYDQPASSSLWWVPAPSPGYWYGLDITDIYNNWKDGVYTNYGFKFMPISVDNEFSQFYSSDLPSAYHYLRPRLVVTYDGANFAFPLAGYTPYTARISSVFDHSVNVKDLVVAYTGETGDYLEYGDTGCINQESGQPFSINGNYVGASSCGGETYLSYDGHPAFDYPVNIGTKVYAAASGVITKIECPAFPGSCTNYGLISIKHDSGYITWYAHLSKQSGSLVVGSYVNKGDLIGYSGDTSPDNIGPHLHFEVRKESGSSSFPVDPYGWLGEAGADPLQVDGKDNVCLWENCQWW